MFLHEELFIYILFFLRKEEEKKKQPKDFFKKKILKGSCLEAASPGAFAESVSQCLPVGGGEVRLAPQTRLATVNKWGAGVCPGGEQG